MASQDIAADGPTARHRAVLVVAGAGLFLATTALTYLFHRYDWDTVENILVPLAVGRPVAPQPYSFLFPVLSDTIAGLLGRHALLLFLVVACNLALFALGGLIYVACRRFGAARFSAAVAAAAGCSSFCVLYASTHLDDNLFQALCAVAAVLALATPGRRGLIWSGLWFGLSGAFHFQSFALAPGLVYLVLVQAGAAPRAWLSALFNWGLAAGLVYGALLLLCVDPVALLTVIGEALSEGRDTFAVVETTASPLLLLGQGAVAALLPFPINIKPLFGDVRVEGLLPASLALLAVVILLAAIAAFRRTGVAELRLVRAALIAFACAVLFAYIVEPNGIERWISAAPFYGICVGQAVTLLPGLRPADKRAGPRAAALCLAGLVVIFAAVLGKPLAYVLVSEDHRLRSAGLIRAIATGFETERLVLLDKGFEMVTFYRPGRTCYFVTERFADQVKCLGPDGPVYHEPTSFLGEQGDTPLAVFSNFPGLGTTATAQSTRRVCDPQAFGRAFGERACIDFVTSR